ncbi:MAG: hypothetical protein ACKPKO_53690 [Candidatus Fonsibacter sp.]
MFIDKGAYKTLIVAYIANWPSIIVFNTKFGNAPPSFKLAYKSIFIDQSAYIYNVFLLTILDLGTKLWTHICGCLLCKQ